MRIFFLAILRPISPVDPTIFLFTERNFAFRVRNQWLNVVCAELHIPSPGRSQDHAPTRLNFEPIDFNGLAVDFPHEAQNWAAWRWGVCAKLLIPLADAGPAFCCGRTGSVVPLWPGRVSSPSGAVCVAVGPIRGTRPAAALISMIPNSLLGPLWT